MTLKSSREIQIMRESAAILRAVLRELSRHIEPGVSTQDLDRKARAVIRSYGAKPAFLGYRGYPATICTSVNEEVVHGIPSSKRHLAGGDIVGVDVGVILDGYYSDAARTWPVGEIDAESEKLIRVTRESFFEGVRRLRVGGFLGDVSHAVQAHVEKNGFSVIRDYVGHGIGRAMHEDPQVPNFGQAGTGPHLEAGLILAIEPMVAAGGWQVEVLPDGWTVVTADRRRSAHYENTVALTAGGVEILTEDAENG